MIGVIQFTINKLKEPSFLVLSSDNDIHAYRI